MTVRQVGVEEELLLVDESGHLTAVSDRVMHGTDDDLDQELFLEQVETQTEPHTAIDDVLADLRACRRRAAEAAAQAGVEVLAVPTPVLPHDEPDVTPKRRYRRMMTDYGEVGRRALACGMHVHVDVADDEEAVRIADGVRPWLPLVVALSANSPFDHGTDTGLASWREQVWDAWPSAGPGEPFGDAAGYRRTVEALVETGAALDEGMVYFDVRLAQNFPTVELRIADLCTDLEDAVVVAAVVRGLAETAASHPSTDEPWRVELLRAARWRARRDGLEGRLVHPVTRHLVPPREAMDVLLDHIGTALDEAGDAALVRDGIGRLLEHGSGAARQRRVAGDRHDLDAVTADLRRRTRDSYA